MSLILDALNRSDSDRAEPGAAPGLHATHGPADGAAGPGLRKYFWPIVCLVLLAAAVLPWLLDDPASQPPSVKPEPLASQAGSIPAATEVAAARPAPAASPTRPAAPTVAAARQDADIAALYRSSEPAPTIPAAVAEVAPAKTAAVETAAVETAAVEIAPVETAPKVEAAPVEVAPKVDVEALARAAEQALAERKARRSASSEVVVEHAAPYIADLSQREKDAIPSIFYNSHAWATNPAERRLVLNGQSFREGDQVKPGLKLVQILENSSVFEYDGTEFQLRALNSWVNL
ncbi:MAG: general secretion pathway protein GspB [Marinobacter sp.]|uniref:general secretion pathway protein GspB n=1 Tax=Marinobacter sp. TaxID=50741 RepID=UPI0032970402